LLYVSLTRAKQALVLSRALKIRRGEVPALGLTRRDAGDPYRQDLRQCRFFSAFSPAVLPTSVDGRGWDGIQLGDLST
jgi:ATP-dependent exoDNAse (exonuclease V) beta subunit